jgi:hypothetical protein
MKGTRVNIVESEFRGGETNLTAALLLLNSNVTVSNCKFTNFRAGAIFCVSQEDRDPLAYDSEEEEEEEMKQLDADDSPVNEKTRQRRLTLRKAKR